MDILDTLTSAGLGAIIALTLFETYYYLKKLKSNKKKFK